MAVNGVDGGDVGRRNLRCLPTTRMVAVLPQQEGCRAGKGRDSLLMLSSAGCCRWGLMVGPDLATTTARRCRCFSAITAIAAVAVGLRSGRVASSESGDRLTTSGCFLLLPVGTYQSLSIVKDAAVA